MPGADDKPANRHQNDSRESADRLLEEVLRQIGADILEEPVPEKLRRVLRPKTGSDESTTKAGRDHRKSRGAGIRRRDDEPSD